LYTYDKTFSQQLSMLRFNIGGVEMMAGCSDPWTSSVSEFSEKTVTFINLSKHNGT